MHDSFDKVPRPPAPIPVRGVQSFALPHTLPRPLTSFLGRERDFAAVRDFLRHEQVRLLTLTGPGGVGKTRLAIQVATELEDDYPDGVGFVPLAEVRDPGQVGASIVRTLRFTRHVQQADDDALARLLRDVRGLIVLDNFEHVVEAATVVSSMLAGSPELKILVTSRQPLNVAGEQVYVVPPLAVTDQGHRADDVQSLPAFRLFVERARSRGAEFALTPVNVSSIAQACRELDGLPLAIELAAAHATTLTPPDLLRRMERRLPLLTRNTVDAPDRHRTMEEAIGWSYELLDAPAQRAFRQLAVFVGGFTLEAAEAVIGHLGETVSILEDLAASSLIVAHPGEEGGTRYFMLETIREFGLERLAASGEEHETRNRHADWVRTVAERSEWCWFMPLAEGEARLAELERERGNIREALAWLSVQGYDESVLEMAGVLGGLWVVLGEGNDGIAWLTPAKHASIGVSQAVRAKALATLSWINNTRANLETALDLAGESLRLADPQANLLDTIYGLVLAGVGAEGCERFDLCRAYNLKAIEYLESLPPEPWIRNFISTVLVDVAHAEFLQGHLDETERWIAEVADRQVRAGTQLGHSHIYGTHVLTFMGDMARLRGDDRLALDFYRQNLELAWRFRNVRKVCYDLGAIGGALAGLGDHTQAAHFLGAAEKCHAQFGYQFDFEAMSCQRALGLPEPWAREADPCPPWDAMRTAARSRYPRTLPPLADPEAAAQTWAAGRELDLSVAVAEALAVKAPGLEEEAGSGLTAREMEVLRLLATGKTDADIADALFISRRTVGNHVQNIYGKLNVSSRAEAAVWAVRHSLV